MFFQDNQERHDNHSETQVEYAKVKYSKLPEFKYFYCLVSSIDNSLSTGKDHESVASIVTSAVGTSDNAAPDK